MATRALSCAARTAWWIWTRKRPWSNGGAAVEGRRTIRASFQASIQGGRRRRELRRERVQDHRLGGFIGIGPVPTPQHELELMLADEATIHLRRW